MFNHIHHDFPKLLQENVDGTRHYVTPTGERYPSVTTVLSDYGKEGIIEWRKKVGEAKANEISRKATTRGTSVHKALEMYLKNEDVSSLEMLPNVKSLFVRMKQEIDSKVNNIHCLEDKLFSHKLGLAGTVDCIAEHNGVLSVMFPLVPVVDNPVPAPNRVTPVLLIVIVPAPVMGLPVILNPAAPVSIPTEVTLPVPVPPA